MSTPKIYIFEKFLSLISDRRLCLDYDDNLRNMILDGYLNKSSSLHFKKCRKNLNLETKPSEHKKRFVGESGNEFFIDEYPEVHNSDSIELFAKVNGEDVDFEFVADDRKFILDESISIEDVLVCGFTYSGEFLEELSDEEQWILALGMVMTFVQYNLYVTDKMRDKIISTDFSQPHSPANLIKELRLLKDDAEIDVIRRVNSYTRESIDFDGFK